jgi:hypothetical protein
MQTELIFNYSEIFLCFLADWSLPFAKQMLFGSVLRTDYTPPIVVIGLHTIFMTGHKQCYSLSRMLKDFDV